MAAAEEIYAWDTRISSYSEVYSRVRGWWVVLADGSNPLTVFVQEFEATGINAASYAALQGRQAYRSATARTPVCDGELAQVRQQPPPWAGLHVCTVTLTVTEHASSSTDTYTAPLSVMANCPPAPTAPVDRCVLVGFYAAPGRIVY